MTDFSEYREIERTLSFFLDISAIPHTSGNCGGIADYLVSFAKKRGLSFYKDESNNVIIKKAATADCEAAPTVILQGHTDMVRATLGEGFPDPEKDALDVYLDGELLKARGTTLGADNGIAVAMMLSILDSSDIRHPKIEAVFTADEEIGLIGAAALDTSLLTGKIMINLDSDEEGIFTAGCAGGARIDITKICDITPKKSFELKIEGLRGGHSGIMIDKGRANAIKLLFDLIPTGSLIGEIEGGNADNAIAAYASLSLVPSVPMEKMIREAEKALRETEPSASITLSEADGERMMFSSDDSSNIISIIKNLPYGPITRNEENSELVESSLNVGTVSTKGGKVTVGASVRSAARAQKEAIISSVTEMARAHGANFSVYGEYPGWEYRRNSLIRRISTEAYMRLFAKEPRTVTIHAGLECGIFAEKIEGLDAISIGPDMFDIHSAAERLSLPSAVRTERLIIEILKTLTEKEII